MRLALTLRASVLLSLCSGALASDFTTPSGFNFESVPTGGPVAAALDDGTILLSTGSFGAEELSRLHGDGTVTVFATGFGSLAGIARSPVTGDIIVGDSGGGVPLWVLRDLDRDGDALDVGEMTPHPAVLPVLPNGAAPLPFDIVFEPGTDVLYASASTPFGVDPLLGVVLRIDGTAASVWADGLGFAGGVVWHAGTLYVADLAADFSAGRVVALTDADRSGDALAPGEAVDFASGLSGAFDLVRAEDGSFYISGLLDFIDFTSPVGRLAPDADDDGVTDGVDELFLDGFVFSSGLVLVEGDRGFVPGITGDGRLYVSDFTYPGARQIRSAPLAGTSLSGEVASDATFEVAVSGAPGAGALFVISMDQSTGTVPLVGDISLGFGAPHLIYPATSIGPGGSAVYEVAFPPVPGLVGTPVTIQGFTLQGGDVGIGDAFDVVIGR